MDDELKKAWEPVHDLIRRGDVLIRSSRTSIPGTYALELTVYTMPYPLGIVWYHFRGKKKIEILNSFVFVCCRRMGIRRMLNEALFNCYPNITRIVSGGATAEGEAFMLSTGYKKNKNGDWVLKRK